MIRELKMCAEFLGWDTVCPKNGHTFKTFYDTLKFKDFNPHEEEGAHWNKKILEKFNEVQWDKYLLKMTVVHTRLKSGPDSYNDSQRTFFKWSLTAPEKIKFKCICEVLKEV